MGISDQPIFTTICDDAHEFCPATQSLYLYGASVEERSEHVERWRQEVAQVRFARVTEESPNAITVEHDGRSGVVHLRSDSQLSQLWAPAVAGPIYIDITGLRHHVWAAMLRSALSQKRPVKVVYVEPRDYQPSLTPTEGEIYDLSERIAGISPLPGFARLRDPGDKFCFVPLLGFEGTRLAYLTEQLDPPGGKIIPIVGVPGFRPEYPFISFLGNRAALLHTQAWRNVRFATANCPYSLFYALVAIQADFPGHFLKVAPIGTKPHAIGAILYAIYRPEHVELVYDHPVRKARRTVGASRLLVYHISRLVG